MLKRLVTTGSMLAIAVLPCASFAAETAPERSTAANPRPLDLKAPEIGKIFSLEQINAVLARATDPALEHIQVEALRLGDLDFQDESAPPAQRIASTVVWLLTPSPTFAAVANPKPDATDPNRPPPYLQASHHAAFDAP